MSSIAVLILTYNEELNIEKCIASVLPLTSKIYIVDSGSTDRTVELAEAMGATAANHRWVSPADQFNWGLENFDFGTDWIMRIDADEEATQGLVTALQNFLKSPGDVSGVYVRRCIYFMGRAIRHGGFYPRWHLRVFRNGIGRCEPRSMDEHIVLSEGGTIKLHQDIIDKNNKDLTFWTEKHNQYASHEVLDVLDTVAGAGQSSEALTPSLTGSQAQVKRWLKYKVYLRLPLFVRPFLYFLYRYFIRFGFLDGKAGLIFHFLQGFWYRFLVDAKLYERKVQMRDSDRGGPPDNGKVEGSIR